MLRPLALALLILLTAIAPGLAMASPEVTLEAKEDRDSFPGRRQGGGGW